MNQKALRQIPSVEKVLQALGETGLPRPLVVTAVRGHVAEIRKAKRIPSFEEVHHEAKKASKFIDCLVSVSA